MRFGKCDIFIDRFGNKRHKLQTHRREVTQSRDEHNRISTDLHTRGRGYLSRGRAVHGKLNVLHAIAVATDAVANISFTFTWPQWASCVIKFISHARKQNKLHLKFKLRDCKSRYYGIIAKLQLPAKCSHDGQIAAVTVWLTAERAATAAEHVLCPQSVKIIERLFEILLWNTRYTSIAFNCE